MLIKSILNSNSKKISSILGSHRLHFIFKNTQTLNNKIEYHFSKKKQHKQTKKSYNIPGMDQQKLAKLPEHLKRVYNVKKQAFNMQVPSQSELTVKIIKEQIIRQRLQFGELQNEYQQKKQEEKQAEPKKKSLINFINKFDNIEKAICTLTIGNTVVLAALSALNIKWLGIYCAASMYPIIMTTGMLILGTNIALMVLRQGLNTHMKLRSLKQVTLTQAPVSYYIQSLVVVLQMWYLSISRHSISQIPLLNSMDPQMISITTGLISLSLVVHAYYQQSKLPWPRNSVTTISSLNFKCLAIMVLIFLGILQKYGSQPEFKKGQDYYNKLWVKQRPTITLGQKINA